MLWIHNFEDILHDYEAVFDTIGGETYRRSLKVLKKGGIIVSMLEQPNSELMNQYGVKAIFQFTQVNRDRLTKLAQWVDQNNIIVNVIFSSISPHRCLHIICTICIQESSI